MPGTAPSYSSTWFSKFFETLYGFIIIAMAFYALADTVLSRLFNNANVDYWVNLFTSYSWMFVVIAVFYATWWHVREKKGDIDSKAKHDWLITALCCYLAYELSVYGFAKILRTQFMPVYSRNDSPIGNLSGFDLTWNYFGYSYTYAVILGTIQILGASLLLFRRTRLPAIFILLPVMVNIVMINVFYDIALGALINSVLFTVALTYLLLLQWKNVKGFFFPARIRTILPWNTIFKSLLKLLTVAAAFGTIYWYVIAEGPSALTGKWTIQEFRKNGKVISDNNWKENPGSWSNIYIEERGNMEMCANPYFFDETSSTTASYKYDSQSHHLVIIYTGIFKTKDKETFTVSNYDGKKMQWNTIYNSDTLQFKLTKAE